jgi:hypothetical protein
MPLTTTEQVALLNSKVAMFELRQKRFEETLARIETKLFPPAAPAAPPAPPPWAGSGDPNSTGINATAPSVPQRADVGGSGIVGVEKDHRGFWRDFSNILRDESGAVATAGILPIRGPERTPAHEQAIQLADKLFDKE